MQFTVRTAAIVALCVSVACGGDAAGPGVVQQAAIASVSVTPAQHTLNVTETVALTATARSSGGAVLSGRTMTWSSSAPTVASVDGAGNVTGAAPGTAIISASVESRVGSATITVAVPVASLVIDSIQPRLIVGRTAQLAFVVLGTNGQPVAGRTPVWTSSNPAVVAISTSGLLTGAGAGTALITGVVDGKSAARIITAQDAPAVVLTLTPETATLARGVDYALTPKITDFDGNPLGGKTVTYTSADPTIATVSAAGVVRPLLNGVVSITGAVDGQYQATVRIAIVDPRTVSGVVMTADGAALPRELVFTARTGAGNAVNSFVTAVDSQTGAFSLRMPTLTATGQSVEFFADVPAGVSRRYHPSYQRLGAGAVPVNPRILLVPHTVVIDSGTYAGRAMAVDLDEAFTPVCTTTSDANCQSYWPSYWLPGIKTWADESRPIPVAFDRTAGVVTPADSLVIWATMTQMEADLGRRLFKPAAFTAYTSTGYTNGMILISNDPTVAPFAGYTNWFWDAQGVLYQAKIRLASANIFANASTSTHELNHALGFHHTCKWSTIMGGYGCGQISRLSVWDVAYYHLAEMVRRRSKATSATWSIAEALQGVRVVALGLAPSNALSDALRPMLSKSGLPGSDAAP